MADVIERDEIAPELAATNGHAESGSLMASLRAKREALAEDKRLDLDIPGYSGLLAARYKPVRWETISEIRDRLNTSKDPRAELLGAADLLIACCEELLTRVDGKYVSLSEAPGINLEGPIRFETRLAPQLGFEAEKTRDVVIEIFRNDFAVIDQNNEVMAWLRDSSAEVDEDF